MLLSIIFIPLLNAFFVGFFGRLFGRNGARMLTSTGMIVSLFLTAIVINQHFHQPLVSNIKLGTWISSELFHINWSFNCDAITLTMFFVVNLISCLVHIYASAYMSEDPHLERFMAYLSLFTFFMLILVTSDNLIQLFLGWEGVGICSYLLISFWYTRIQANKSAIKALIVNRVSDVFLTLGIIAAFCTFRDVQFPTIFSLAPFFLEQPINFFGFPVEILTIITFLFMLGAMGKSAQILLHTWLPDAMEGPTPVSALIHAATMVTAGVFLIIKCSPLFEFAGTTLLMLSLIGGLTAFFSSTVGLVQSDIKKVIAYSTCSQLGYMIFACGLSAYNVSLFHLMNHAIFKALLFLSAGAVIHSVSNEQDMRRMGGLTKLLPFSYACITIGSLALLGFPFLTGFYSKDVILEIAYSQYNIHGSFVHWLGTITAFFTAFYSFRLLYLSFLRESRLHKRVVNQIHESPVAITIPLAVLSVGSIFVGYLTKDLFVGVGSAFLSHSLFVVPSRNSFLEAEFLPFYIKNLPFFLSLFSAGVIVSVYFFFKTYAPMYQKTWKTIYSFLTFKWYFDLVYNKYVNQPLLHFGYTVPFKFLDKGLIEILGPHGIYNVMQQSSLTAKKLQSGRIYQYAAYILLSFLVILTAIQLV